MTSEPPFCVLIPSRGRPEILRKSLERMPFLNVQHTIIGIEGKEWPAYQAVLGRRGYRTILYDNPEGSVAIAREALRVAAMPRQRGGILYEWFVCTDDNARYSAESLKALVASAEAYRQAKKKPIVFMAGMHSTAPHFDRGLIERTTETVGGWTSYQGFGFIFHAVPREWYENYSYPPSCFALEDRHMMLSAIAAGHREFRVCMGAPFSKTRYQPGGQGDINKRRWNCGRAIEQLAHDFPEDVGVRGTFPLPWQMIVKLRDGTQVDRLMGGAMRKGDKLEVSGKLMARRVRR